MSGHPNPKCPHCGSNKNVIKAGKSYYGKIRQKYLCKKGKGKGKGCGKGWSVLIKEGK